MGIFFSSSINIISTIIEFLVWGFIVYFVYRIYKSQEIRPKIWKVIIVIIIGIFTFSINFNMPNFMIKIPILPLGVWILYLFFRNNDERWKKYRSYAWLGFWTNFMFLAGSLIAIPIYQVVFPKESPSTYISNIEHAYIIGTHPSGEDTSLNKEKLMSQLHTMKEDSLYSDKWYEDTFLHIESNKRNEQFPYQLIGVEPKWGSGLHSIIFIEENGKGILISTSDEQLYFQFEDSLIEEAEEK